MPEQPAVKHVDAPTGAEDLDYQTTLSSSILSCDDVVYGTNISHIDKNLIDIFRYAVYQGRIDDIDAMIKVNPELSKDEVSTFIVYATGNQEVLKRFPADSDDDIDGSEELPPKDNALELQQSGFEWHADYFDAIAPSHDLGELQHVDEDSTLGDGNCAFNAFAQGLVRLLRAGQTNWIAVLFAYINAPHLSLPEREAMTLGALVHLVAPAGAEAVMTEAQQQAFCEALLNYSSVEQQRMLAPLLRHKAVSAIANPHMYQTMYRLGFEERLKLTYASYLYRQSLSTFESDPAFIQVIQLLTAAYIEYDGDEDSGLFMAWWHGESTGYQACLAYASSAHNAERFHQWLTWLNTANIVDYARHYTYAEPIEDSALLINFPHIRERLEAVSYQSEADFLAWWEDSGKATYFTQMLTPAANAQDRHKWGSDDEISVLALDFNLNVAILKDNAMDVTVVGMAEGTMLESMLLAEVGDADVNRLIQLGLVETITRFDGFSCTSHLRFRQGALEKLAVFSTPVPVDLNIEALITQYEEQSAVTPMSTREFLLQNHRLDLLLCFEARGVLNSATDNFITDQVQLADGTSIYPIDRTRIHACLLNIHTETVTYLQTLLAPVTISFTIRHHHDHWSCQAEPHDIQRACVVDSLANVSSRVDRRVLIQIPRQSDDSAELDTASHAKKGSGASHSLTLFGYWPDDEPDYSPFDDKFKATASDWVRDDDHEEEIPALGALSAETSQLTLELAPSLDAAVSEQQQLSDGDERPCKKHCARR